MAKEGATVWKKFGALEYKECRGDNLAPKGVVLTFPKLVKPKSGEEVWFSYITYKSKAHCNSVNKKVMAYFSKKYKDMKDFKMPFDEKRMSRAGFTVEVGF